MYHRRIQLLIAACAALLGASSGWSATHIDGASTDAPIESIWRIQEFDFYFRATNGRYHSCSSLREKISGIMEAVGAGAVIVNVACSRDAFVDNTFARVVTATPAHATVANIAAATSFATEQKLVARLHGAQLPNATTLERFPAEWREVALKKIRGVPLGAADCDLLHDLHEQIFAHLASIRVVRKRLACGNAALQSPRPILVVEALVRREA